MKLTNLANTFTIFGNFAVFDEDNLSIINKVYADCNIAINNEPVREANKSGRYMQITDPKKHITIFLRPTRIDVQTPGVDHSNKDKLLNDVNDIYRAFSQMFSEWGNRVAYVGSYFIFDDNDEILSKVSKRINILSEDNKPSEINLRLNHILDVNGEMCNDVFSVNNVRIGASANPNERRKALMFTFDINTVASSVEERFNIYELRGFYESFYDLAYSQIQEIEEIDN